MQVADSCTGTAFNPGYENVCTTSYTTVLFLYASDQVKVMKNGGVIGKGLYLKKNLEGNINIIL